MKNKHEELGIKYLIEKLGYKREDIEINVTSDTNGLTKRGSPDLITLSDGKEWEVKQLENMSTTTFTSDQYQRFDKNVNVLIFKNPKHVLEEEDKFIMCIKFEDILNQTENFGYTSNLTGYRYDLRFMVAYKVDMCIAEGVSCFVRDAIDGHSFLLSSGDVEIKEKYEHIARHPKDFITKILTNAVEMNISIEEPLEIILEKDLSINMDKIYNTVKNKIKR